MTSMKLYCWTNMETVQSVAELLEVSEPDLPLIMTIIPEKSGDFFATIVIEGWSEDIAKKVGWNILGRLSRISKKITPDG